MTHFLQKLRRGLKLAEALGSSESKILNEQGQVDTILFGCC
jgi:hypothetical protein